MIPFSRCFIDTSPLFRYLSGPITLLFVPRVIDTAEETYAIGASETATISTPPERLKMEYLVIQSRIRMVLYGEHKTSESGSEITRRLPLAHRQVRNLGFPVEFIVP